MSKQSDQVAIGFMRLTTAEQQDVIAKLTTFMGTPPSGQKQLTESFRVQAGLDLGPTSQGSCKCCGR